MSGATPDANGHGHPRRRTIDATLRAKLAALDGMWFLLDPGPGLTIVEASESFAGAATTTRDSICGKPLFEAFPDNPDRVEATGVANLYRSIVETTRTGRLSQMAPQRYDVSDEDGQWARRCWYPSNEAIFGESGELLFILHRTRLATPEESVSAEKGESAREAASNSE